jgi:hypothetical protein
MPTMLCLRGRRRRLPLGHGRQPGQSRPCTALHRSLPSCARCCCHRRCHPKRPAGHCILEQPAAQLGSVCRRQHAAVLSLQHCQGAARRCPPWPLGRWRARGSIGGAAGNERQGADGQGLPLSKLRQQAEQRGCIRHARQPGCWAPRWGSTVGCWCLHGCGCGSQAGQHIHGWPSRGGGEAPGGPVCSVQTLLELWAAGWGAT